MADLWVLGRYGPLVAALSVFTALLLANAFVTELAGNSQFSIAGLYSAVFGWSSIQTGFLFGVYGFVAGKRAGFMGALAGTPLMQRFSTSLRRAIIVGFALTFVSMPLIAYPLEPTSFDVTYLIVSAWFSMFVWAFGLFANVAFTFGRIVVVPDRDDRPAG